MNIWKEPTNDWACFATCSIHASYNLLDLLTFLRAGGQQVRFCGSSLFFKGQQKGQMTLRETLSERESSEGFKIWIRVTFVHPIFSLMCELFARVFTCWRVCAVVFQWTDFIFVALGCLVKLWAVITGIIAAAVFALVFYQWHWNVWYEMFQSCWSDLSTSIVLCDSSCDGGEIQFVCLDTISLHVAGC